MNSFWGAVPKWWQDGLKSQHKLIE